MASWYATLVISRAATTSAAVIRLIGAASEPGVDSGAPGPARPRDRPTRRRGSRSSRRPGAAAPAPRTRRPSRPDPADHTERTRDRLGGLGRGIGHADRV